jgi:hypothetical protein
MFADFGEAITVGGVAGVGIVDEEDQAFASDSSRGNVVVPISKITVQTSAFPACEIDDPVSVRAQNYKIRLRLRIHDGALTELMLGA